MDTLKLTGLGKRYDGEYQFDIAEMIGIGGPAMINGHEMRLIKQESGVRPAEFFDAAINDDWDFHLSIAAIVLARHDKQITVAKLRDLPAASVEFDFEDRVVVVEDDDADDPPAVTATQKESDDGGLSGKPTSDPPANDPSPTGLPVSPRSATSDPLTLVS